MNFLEFEYQITEKGTVVTKYTGDNAIVTVPSEINGHRVTAIGEGAFRDCKFILEVVLPEGLMHIGDYAFCQCRGLTEIELPKTVEVVGNHSFYNCRNLHKMTIPAGLKYIGDGFIKNCDEIHEIILDTAKTIGSGVAVFLSEIKEEFCLTVKDSGVRLIFAEYEYEYITNAPAMQCKTVTHGAGIRYRQAISVKGINFDAYDNAFAIAVIEERQETVFNIIFTRFSDLENIKNEYLEKYIQYLKENIESCIIYVGKKGNVGLLEMMGRVNIFNDGNIDTAVETAAKTGNSELSALMLDIKLSRFGTRDKSFDL
ncbi:MAG: leucine-rich repeat domain-containing protein [Anaerotignaceae bacterium]